ncbi:hypothetical protein EY675_00050 [Enterococcus casseliflavus]|uniref:ATP-grasp fold amidoligase family protein n=1 Tax=Enterococcus casseliflavus TaxID=37734 RepID=UPI001AD73FE7|nr:ATP-grasp fold amidoligase family protein [Enterococcus casseliflavus]MBO6383963.1 hypothetical protein [Enterococcus casseliflavus]
MSAKEILKKSPMYSVFLRFKILYLKQFKILITKRKFKEYYNFNLNLIKPEYLSEKIQYLKLFQYPFDKKVVLAADKYTLKNYLTDMKLDKYITPYLFVVENSTDVDMSKLPNSFVLKKTNASGLNLIVKDIEKIDNKKISQTIDNWMVNDYGVRSSEFHYSKAKSRILFEPLFNLGNEFRFFMVSGKLAFIQIIVWDWEQDTNGNSVDSGNSILGHMKHYRIHLDENFEILWKDSGANLQEFVKPSYWNDILDVSYKIGKDFPLVRIDFNDIDGIPKISELTFTPANGFLSILKNRRDLDEKFGSWLNLGDYYEKDSI